MQKKMNAGKTLNMPSSTSFESPIVKKDPPKRKKGCGCGGKKRKTQ